ncbi:MAG: hypothetical protein P0Y56_09695 [Candidatus Andeanibacterium colombiense]|uniref:Uncharacterized protein n=1 Tax=Candidatus Andeanibacterium colombiense TaxID=3121345 RepID=A0AAJ6BN58_9SPHN|nr:MAG: hypothetical protein P0Y56_09695 [Sphingomonadaceae bacterium]
MRNAALALLGALALAGCGKQDTDPGPGGVTVGEAKALDEAAEMIDSRKLPSEALEEGSASPAPSGAPGQ